eukprot:3815419-Pleurochrysis_carterae.AAC.2
MHKNACDSTQYEQADLSVPGITPPRACCYQFQAETLKFNEFARHGRPTIRDVVVDDRTTRDNDLASARCRPVIKLGCWPTRAPLRGTATLSERVGSVSDQTWLLPYSGPISAPGQLGTADRGGWLLESDECGENA